MSGPKVLIVFGTRYGTTTETAKEIGKILESKGLEVSMLNLKEVKSKNWPAAKDFNGVIIGSSIKIGRWMKEPQKFMKKNQAALNDESIPLGVFVSCMACLTDMEKANTEYLADLVAKKEIHADLMGAFGPILDFSANSKQGWFARGILKSIAEKQLETTGYNIDFNGRTDLRDLNAIHKFAESFAELVQEAAP
jgi:menaquinone-dependent protoporphyrinogen oxidase